MSDHARSPLDLALMVFGSFFVLSVLAFWATFRFGGPIAADFGVSVMGRSVSRKVILSGVSDVSDALQRIVQRCRWLFAGDYACEGGHK